MTLLNLHFLFLLALGNPVIYDFSHQSDLQNWKVVDDSVMGGISQGNFSLNKEGHAVFSGTVSIENNGGFSSVRYNPIPRPVGHYSKIKLRIKGDGKTYQFRVKSEKSEYHSYVFNFQTKKDWHTVDIPFIEMYPSFRGRKLNVPNYPGEQIAEIAFLIANKRNERFKLEIDRIELE